MLQKLIKHYSLTSICVLALSVSVHPAHAQATNLPQSVPAEELEAEEDKAQLEPTKPKVGEKLIALEEYTAGLLKGLKPQQAQYIFQLRQEFGVIRSIQVVQKDIGKAVESCGNEHEDLKAPIMARYESWKAAVAPKLNAADNALKKAIGRQSFRPTVRVSMLLDHVEAAFEERDAQLEKVPVTTKDACQILQDSMDNTQENLLNLLDETATRLSELDAREKEAEEAMQTPQEG